MQVAPEWRLRVLAYWDAVRMRHRDDAEALAGYDVVLCTYGCLVHDSPLKGEPRGIFKCARGLRVSRTGVACSVWPDWLSACLSMMFWPSMWRPAE